VCIIFRNPGTDSQSVHGRLLEMHDGTVPATWVDMAGERRFVYIIRSDVDPFRFYTVLPRTLIDAWSGTTADRPDARVTTDPGPSWSRCSLPPNVMRDASNGI
jgi:hypothetical protein